MFGHIEMDDFPPIMRQNDEDKQNLECRGRHNKEVDSDEASQVETEKCPPGRGGRSISDRFVLFDGRFRDFDAKHAKLCDYSR